MFNSFQGNFFFEKQKQTNKHLQAEERQEVFQGIKVSYLSGRKSPLIIILLILMMINDDDHHHDNDFDDDYYYDD